MRAHTLVLRLSLGLPLALAATSAAEKPAPEKAPEKAPDKAPEKAPDKAPDKAPEKPAANPGAEARKKYAEGSALYEKKQYDKAIAAFEEARAIQPGAYLDFNLGRAYEQVGRWREAIEAYERFVAASPDDEDAPDTKQRVVALKLRSGITPSFAPAATYATAARPRGLVFADFNNDQQVDLAVAAELDRAVTILLGDGKGAFRVPSKSFPARVAPVAIAVGDEDKDGRADLFMVDGTQTRVVALSGNGDGTFASKGALYYGVDDGPAALGLASLGVIDLDRDGAADVVASALSGVLLQVRGGGKTTQLAPKVGTATVLQTGDFVGDGNPDAALLVPAQKALLLYAGDGRTGVRPAGRSPVVADARAFAIADVTGDKKPDLAVVSAAPQIALYPGTAKGRFGGAKTVPLAAAATGIAVADFDGDGKPDVATVGPGRNVVSVIHGADKGAFDPEHTFGVLPRPVLVAAQDLDGNGKPDLVVASEESGVTVLLNTR